MSKCVNQGGTHTETGNPACRYEHSPKTIHPHNLGPSQLCFDHSPRAACYFVHSFFYILSFMFLFQCHVLYIYGQLASVGFRTHIKFPCTISHLSVSVKPVPVCTVYVIHILFTAIHPSPPNYSI